MLVSRTIEEVALPGPVSTHCKASADLLTAVIEQPGWGMLVMSARAGGRGGGWRLVGKYRQY